MTQPLPISHPPDPPATIDGHYLVLAPIARGGMGEVFRVRDVRSDQVLALKRMRADGLGHGQGLLHFRREYQSLRSLAHPRIIAVHDFGFDGSLPYYTMELLDGEDLGGVTTVSPAEVCAYLRDVASSIALLHARRLLHRDLSPRNVVRLADGRCKLLDFGTMVPFGVPPNVAGTAPLLAPEALQGAPLDQRADLYSLGGLGYRLLTGRHAHSARSFDMLPASWRRPPARPRRFSTDIPVALDELIMSLLEIDPTARPASAGEVIERLTAIGGLAQDDSVELARSYLTSTAMPGRDAELSLIERRLERAEHGHGSALLIQGEPGLGKARLLSEATLRAHTRGFITVRIDARRRPGELGVARELASALERAAPTESGRLTLRHGSAFRSLAPPSGSADTSPDRGELRARLQGALTDWVTAVTRSAPLLIVVDDLQQADEFSLAMVAALAHGTATMPLLLVASEDATQAPGVRGALAAFVSAATEVRLSPLDFEGTHALVSSLFSDAPNTERLSRWIFHHASGNPAASLALAQHLVDRDLVRYEGGIWLLPADVGEVEIPAEVTDATSAALSKLSARGKALAQLLWVHGGAASPELCMAASDCDESDTLAALEELLAANLLVDAGEQVVVSRELAGSSLIGEMPEADRRALHTALAGALLAGSDPSTEARLWAGWHLVHTDDALRGADILAATGPRMARAGLAPQTAARAMEKALQIYEAHGRPLAARLSLQSALVLSGYLHDPALATRHGERTLEMLYRITGNSLARRLAPFVGPRLALLFSFTARLVGERLTTPSQRPPPFASALRMFGRTLMSLIGLRATMLDHVGAARLASSVEMLRTAPRITGGKLAHAACKAFAMMPLGHEAEQRAAVDAALQELELLDQMRFRVLGRRDRDDLKVGLKLMQGINECFVAGSRALEVADEVERIGAQLSNASAESIRMVYHLVRGYQERTAVHRRNLELHGIRGGTTWQVDAFAPPIEGMMGVSLGDVVGTRRALDRLERLVEEAPSLTSSRDMVRIGYHHGRGDHQRVLELAEEFLVQYPPHSIIGWAAGYAAIANSMIELGQVERAWELADGAFARVSDAERNYYALYHPLAYALATADALLGNRERSDANFAQCEARLTAAGEQTGLAALHEARARLARKRGDSETLVSSLVSLELAARLSGSPTLVAQATRVAGWVSRMTGASPRIVLHARTLDSAHNVTETITATSEEGLVTRVLLDCADRDLRIRNGLRVAVQSVGAEDGFLFVPHDDGLELAASLDEHQPPESLERAAAALLREGAAPRARLAVAAHGSVPDTRYYLARLSGRDSGTCVGVLVLAERGDPIAAPAPAMLEQIGRALGH